MSTTDPNAPPISAPPAAPPPARTITPEEYDALQAEYNTLTQTSAAQRAVLERLSPYADDIEWLVEDKGAIDAVRNTRKALKAMRESQEPTIDPNLKPIYDRVTHLDEFVTGLQKREQEEAERPAKEQAARYESWKNDVNNDKFFKKIAAQYPDDLKGPQLRYLAELAAANDFASLETVWNSGGCRIVGAEPPQSQAPPPSSLRADAGEAGATPPAATPPQTGADISAQMRARIVQLERARRGMAS